MLGGSLETPAGDEIAWMAVVLEVEKDEESVKIQIMIMTSLPVWKRLWNENMSGRCLRAMCIAAENVAGAAGSDGHGVAGVHRLCPAAAGLISPPSITQLATW